MDINNEKFAALVQAAGMVSAAALQSVAGSVANRPEIARNTAVAFIAGVTEAIVG